MARGSPVTEKEPTLSGVDTPEVVGQPTVKIPTVETATDASNTPKEDAAPPPIEELFALDRDVDTEKIRDIIERHIDWRFQNSALAKTHTILVLHDAIAISRPDADRIYKGLSNADKKRPILLILNSPGGDVAAAYFIGKMCRENTSASFEVVVPRQAKSAATLISCAADKIHMGSLSELGPIDPQIRRMPALAVKHSLEHLSELVTQYPHARGMLSDYLTKSMPIEVLGYYERAAHSAVQYAERLLSLRTGVESTAQENSEIARKLVYEYKDHGFAIDYTEATQIFGNSVVVRDSTAYEFSNQLYQLVDFLVWYLDRTFNRTFAYTGALRSGAWLRNKTDSDF